MGALLGALKEQLKDQAKDIKFSTVLVTAPSRVVADEFDVSPYLEKNLEPQRRKGAAAAEDARAEPGA
jgi:HSP90 family molecular chaperone